jgi:hypothetical protein
MDTATSDHIFGEAPTLYHLIRRHKRRSNNYIRSIRDDDGVIQTSQNAIASAFTRFFQHDYNNIDVDAESLRIFGTMIQTTLPDDFASTYEAPFTATEIQHAILSGGANKAPGHDGLGADFYKVAWPIIGDDLDSF